MALRSSKRAREASASVPCTHTSRNRRRAGEVYTDGEPELATPEVVEATATPRGRSVVDGVLDELEEELLEEGPSPEAVEESEGGKGDSLGEDTETDELEGREGTEGTEGTEEPEGTGGTEANLVAEPEERLGALEEEEFGEGEVEAALDHILAQRTATGQLEEEAAEGAGGEALRRQFDIEGEPVVVAPRQPDEFVCSGCFLLKRRELLADAEHGLCRDCTGSAPGRRSGSAA